MRNTGKGDIHLQLPDNEVRFIVILYVQGKEAQG